MSKLAKKFNKRIMAVVLSAVMVITNMTVYASESSVIELTQQMNETVEEVEGNTENSIEDETPFFLLDDEFETTNLEEKDLLESENSTDSEEATLLQNDAEDNNEPELIKITGAIIGLDEKALGAVKIIFEGPEDRDYDPEVTVYASDAFYEAALESGIVYTIKTEGINDYQLDDETENNGDTITAVVDEQRDIIYTKKTTYEVIIEPVGATFEDFLHLQILRKKVMNIFLKGPIALR